MFKRGLSDRIGQNHVMVFTVIMTGLFFSTGFVTPGESAVYNRRTPIVEAVEKALPAVVNISTTKVVNISRSPFPPYMQTPFDDLFKEKYQIEGLGSGVVVDGLYIITNYHVVAYDEYRVGPADRILITFNDTKEEREATLIGADPSADVAILQFIGEPHEKFLHWGRSDDLMIGETVIAIGSALGQPFTVTSGIISALNRSIEAKNRRLNNLIQTNADINRGNSGGPLININGEFIGLNTAIISPTGGSVGLGLAIPVSRVKKIYDYWVNHILSLEDQMGLEIQDMNPSLKGWFHKYYATLSEESLDGVVVLTVSPHAISTGQIIRRDIIVSVDGQSIENSSDFLARLEEHQGSSVKLGIIREGNKIETVLPSASRKVETILFQGMEIQELDNPWRRWLDLTDDDKELLVVLSVIPGSEAEKAVIQRGDVLIAANQIQLHSLNDLRQAIPALNRARHIQLDTARQVEKRWKGRPVRLQNEKSL